MKPGGGDKWEEGEKRVGKGEEKEEEGKFCRIQSVFLTDSIQHNCTNCSLY